ncbi:hypothetical protein LUX57_03355 [Actinomadura madurae]|nr:hypothetical protein [Actinomadura madurae]MCP9964326.1 hypothetical protein [Actinomadura madurae]
MTGREAAATGSRPARQRRGRGRGHEGLLGVRADGGGEVGVHGGDGVPGREAGDGGAGRGDDAGEGQAEADRAGEPEDLPGRAGGDEGVDGVDRCRRDADAQVAVSGRGQRHLLQGGRGGAGLGHECERHGGLLAVDGRHHLR